jgi:selenide,water dikinase
LHEDNARTSCRVQGAAPLPAWLFDPQTSGGLLAGVRAEAVSASLDQLRRVGFARATEIGEVVEIEAAEAPTIFLADG